MKKMKRSLLFVLLAAGLAPAAIAGKPVKCTNLRLSWEIDDSVTGRAIGSDGLGVYVDGQQGSAGTGFICNGGFDATLQIDQNQRDFYLDFSRQVAPTVETRTDLIAPFGGHFLNVRNLLSGYLTANGDRRGDQYEFTTGMMGYLTFGNLHMNAKATDLVNTPYTTSSVLVTHYPVPDEKFVVTPLPTTSTAPEVTGKPIASLLVTKGRTTTNIGQFETPFQITIRILR